MKSLYKTETPIFIRSVFFGFQRHFFPFILLHYNRVAAVERLPVHHHSADYISFPFGSLDPLWYIIFENGVLIMYTPEGVENV